MLIFKCDNCGAEISHKQIAGNEFRHDFETLVPRCQFEDVIDVCSECFKKVRAASKQADSEATDKRTKAYQRLVKQAVK